MNKQDALDQAFVLLKQYAKTRMCISLSVFKDVIRIYTRNSHHDFQSKYPDAEVKFCPDRPAPKKGTPVKFRNNESTFDRLGYSKGCINNYGCLEVEVQQSNSRYANLNTVATHWIELEEKKL